jgi:pyruvate dehydrogenase E2 component (dihydrolipoamide acetyltransferase)
MKANLVEKGEIYVEIQTDKVNIEDEAESSGILRKIIAKEGETVKVGEPIAIIARAHEELPDLEINDNISIQNQEKSSPVFQQQVDKIEAVKQTIPDKIKASPAAKRVARENQIDLSKITPSGPNERIVEKDVLSYIQEHKIKATPVAKKIATERQIDLKSLQKSPGQRITKQDLEEHPVIQDVDNTIPVTGMRKIIADSMTYSKKVAPHIYLSLEVDMSKVIDIREN